MWKPITILPIVLSLAACMGTQRPQTAETTIRYQPMEPGQPPRPSGAPARVVEASPPQPPSPDGIFAISATPVAPGTGGFESPPYEDPRTPTPSTVRYEPVSVPVSETIPRAPLAPEGRPTTPPTEAPKVSPSPKPSPWPATFDIKVLPNGLALPYPTDKVFRGFGVCRRGRYAHPAIDLGGVGPDWGLGTPIRAMARSEVVMIGRGKDDPEAFGTPDRRKGKTKRAGQALPRSKVIPPYGKVTFFTTKKGRWRSGDIVVTRVLEGALKDHTIRYMHLGAPHPDLKVGTILERGQELGLMGGTAVQESAPHVHIDITDTDGVRVDVAPLLGLPPTAVPCELPVAQEKDIKQGQEGDIKQGQEGDIKQGQEGDIKQGQEGDIKQGEPQEKKGDKRHSLDKIAGRTAYFASIPLGKCGELVLEEDFSSGRTRAHEWPFTVEGGGKWTVEIYREDGDWRPRLSFEGGEPTVRASGKSGAKAVSHLQLPKEASGFKLTVSGWEDPTPEARYRLVIKRSCRGL